MVSTEASELVRRADLDDIDRWWKANSGQLTDLVVDGYGVTAGLGAGYMTATGELAGAAITPVLARAAPERISESLRISGPVAFKKNLTVTGDIESAERVMLDRTRASTTRLTLAGSRDTVMGTVADSDQIVGFRRIAQPGACDFCTMLARRGAVYKTRGGAASVVGRGGRPRGNQRVGRSYHDSCRCLPEPIVLRPPPVLSPGDQERVQARVERAARRGRIEEARQANKIAAERLASVGAGRVDPELLTRWGVTEDQFLNARAVVADIKRDVRDTARKESDNLSRWLDDNDLGTLTRPDRLERSADMFGRTRSVRGQSGYDFLETLDEAELTQIRRRFTESDLFAPDLVAEQVRRKTNLDLTDDQAMDWLTERWLHADALRSLSSGRVPRYANADTLIPSDYALEGYRIDQLFGVDLDDAAGHVASVQAQAAQEYAERTLGNPTHGPAPWEMDLNDYLRELEDVEGIIGSTVVTEGIDPGDAFRVAQARIRELAPADIDLDGNMNPVELFEAIRVTAQTAGRLDG